MKRTLTAAFGTVLLVSVLPLAHAQCYTIPCRTGATAGSASFGTPVYVKVLCSNTQSSGSTIACTGTPTTAGDGLAILVENGNIGTPTNRLSGCARSRG